MAKIKIEIEMTNDAFFRKSSYETARILKELAEKIDNPALDGWCTIDEHFEGKLKDINGNTVGKYYTTGKFKNDD